MDADVACGNVAATRQRTGLSVRAGQSLAPRKLMNARDYLNDDGHVLLALCSAFGLPDNAEAEGLTPFKLAEWNQLSRKIAASSLKQPAALQGQNADALARELAVAPNEGLRIARLLDRAGRLAPELENLFSRGMWVVTRLDERYPAKLRDTLKHQAPTVLFGAGEIHFLSRAGIAVIGSRNIDEAGRTFAQEIGRKCAASKMPVVSGGARGTDRFAMDGAMAAGGIALGALADSLEATVRKPDVRQLLLDERLALITPYAPTAGFAVVVSSDHQSGGTWAGAVEALKAGWCPVFVRDGEGVPKGNRELLKLGASPLPTRELSKISNLSAWMNEHGAARPPDRELFDFALREKAE